MSCSSLCFEGIWCISSRLSGVFHLVCQVYFSTLVIVFSYRSFLGSDSKAFSCNAGFIRFSYEAFWYIQGYNEEGNGHPLQYSCLENPMNRGAWWAAVHGVAKSRTRATSLSLFTFMHWRRKWQPTPVFLPAESQRRGSLMGCHLWGCTESDTPEAT